MTICPKCREIAAKVADERAERARHNAVIAGPVGFNAHTWAAAEDRNVANEIRALPTHPQDAEVREGLADVMYDRVKTYEAEYGNSPNFHVLADAVLAYLASQGWRRVGEGEVESAKLLRELIAGIDKGAVKIESHWIYDEGWNPNDDGPNDEPPRHLWHDEWLHYARRAMLSTSERGGA